MTEDKRSFFITVSSIRDTIVVTTDSQNTTLVDMVKQLYALRSEFSTLCTLSVVDASSGRICVQYIGAGQPDDPTLMDSAPPFRVGAREGAKTLLH